MLVWEQINIEDKMNNNNPAMNIKIPKEDFPVAQKIGEKFGVVFTLNEKMNNKLIMWYSVHETIIPKDMSFFYSMSGNLTKENLAKLKPELERVLNGVSEQQQTNLGHKKNKTRVQKT